MDTITMLDCLALGFAAGAVLVFLVAWVRVVLKGHECDGPHRPVGKGDD